MKIRAVVSFVFLTAFTASAQTPMTFTYQIDGLVPPPQTFSVTNGTYPNQQIPYLSVTADPASWLRASLSATTTPAVVTVSLLEAGLTGLAPGNYAGNVQVTSPFSSNLLNVPVTLTVTAAAPRLSLSPSGFVFNAFENGPAPPAQTLVVGGSNAGVSVSSNFSPALPIWLFLYDPLPNDPTSPWTGGIAPVTLTVAVRQTGLAPGSYSYAIPFTSAEGSNVTANVTLLVAAPAVSVSTNQVQLQCSAGLTNPPPQSLQVQSTSGSSLNASVTVSVPWLATNVQSGTTPFSLVIQPACSALAVGTYTGKIIVADTSFSDSQTINVVLTVGQPLSSIANVTNAAVPGLDNPPTTITLAPRSMATIFGSNLADSIVVSPSPWSSPLGGTEVHLASDSCFDASCDLIANLIYVSPAQINFLVPDTTATGPDSYRIVLLRDGQRIDDQSYMLGGPGRLIIDSSGATDSSVVFEVGYDCLFSASLSDPAACGLSWSNGQDRAPVGAITDAISGQLITSQNPAYQGRLVTLWMTGLAGGVALDSKTGLETAKAITPVGFGVAQLGKDVEGTLGVQTPTAPDTPSIPIGTFMSPAPLWAGESPQFVGLDQINVAFPTCANVPAAASEKRYDAFLTYTSVQTGATSRIYIPFDVRVGDPDCQWTTIRVATSMNLASNPTALAAGQAAALTAAVTPAGATGVVTFFDGGSMLGSATLSSGAATLSVSTLVVGSHSITAVYNGDTNSVGSSASLALTVTVGSTAVSVTSNKNPAVPGAAVTFTATVSPAAATGSVTFLDGSMPIGSATLHAGTATLTVTTLSGGSHTITATYSGDSNYLGSTSAPLTQSVGTVSSSIAIKQSDSVVPWGHSVVFTATISPSTATGTVTLFDGILANCNSAPVQLGSATTGGGRAQFSASFTCTGVDTCNAASSACYSPSPPPHQLWAVYSGDTNTAGSTSQSLEVTVTGTPTSISIFGGDPSSISNSSPPPGELAVAYEDAWIPGSVEFFYMTPAGSVVLQCGGAGGNVPLQNGQAVCNTAPDMFPGPGFYVLHAAFYPASSQYYYSDTIGTNNGWSPSVQVTP